MKFIKLRNENYINVSEVKFFCLTHGGAPTVRAIEKNGEIHDIQDFPTRKDAEKWLTKLITELNGGTP